MSTAAHDGEAPLPRPIPLRSMTKLEPNTRGRGHTRGDTHGDSLPPDVVLALSAWGDCFFFFFDWE